MEVSPSLQLSRSVHATDVFVSDTDAEKGIAKVVLTNYLGFTENLESGEDIGSILPVDLVENEEVSQGVVSRVVTNKKHD